MTDRVSSERLALRAQRGDTLASDTLVTRYTGMASAIASGYFLAGADRDDVRQEALVGLWKAIRDYRDGLGSTFGSFAALCIQRQVITAIKAANRAKHQPLSEAILFSKTVHGLDGDRMQLGDMFDDDGRGEPHTQLVEREEFRALISFLATRLSPLELETLRGRLNGESYADTERRLGLSDLPPGEKAKVVDNAIQRIRGKALRFIDEERDAA